MESKVIMSLSEYEELIQYKRKIDELEQEYKNKLNGELSGIISVREDPAIWPGLNIELDCTKEPIKSIIDRAIEEYNSSRVEGATKLRKLANQDRVTLQVYEEVYIKPNG